MTKKPPEGPPEEERGTRPPNKIFKYSNIQKIKFTICLLLSLEFFLEIKFSSLNSLVFIFEMKNNKLLSGLYSHDIIIL